LFVLFVVVFGLAWCAGRRKPVRLYDGQIIVHNENSVICDYFSVFDLHRCRTFGQIRLICMTRRYTNPIDVLRIRSGNRTSGTVMKTRTPVQRSNLIWSINYTQCTTEATTLFFIFKIINSIFRHRSYIWYRVSYFSTFRRVLPEVLLLLINYFRLISESICFGWRKSYVYSIIYIYK